MVAWPFHPAHAALTLATAEPPPGKDLSDLVDPFVGLADGRGFSRVLLGEVLGPRQTPVLRVALKLQGDEYPFLPEGGAAALTNDVVEAGWRREAALLERCGGPRSGLLPLVEVLERAPGEAALLPPTLFCKRRRAFFRAACPECGEPLADVRDDRLLEDRGLPRRDRSLVRFLGCAACLRRGEVRLWTLVRDPRFGPDVGDQADLVRAFGRLARREGRALPCQGCEHTAGCYPEAGAGEALRLLVPVTFYESRCLAVPPLALRYDECVALCGGASLDAVVTGIDEPGRAALVGEAAAGLAARPAYLFAHDMAGKFGLEVLRLKLALFAELCRATALVHRHALEPHLALAPDRAMASLDAEPAGLPWLWRLGVSLLGLGNAVPRALPPGMAGDAAVRAYARPALIDPVFAAPALREGPRTDVPVTVTPRRVGASGDGGVGVEADLETDAVDLSTLGDKDVLDVSVVQGRPPLSLHLAAVAVGMAGSALRVRGVARALDPREQEVLSQLVGQPLSRARCTIHPCLHVPADVHSLGMILFVTLLAHPGRPAADVARAVDDVVRRLVLAAGEGRQAEDVLVARATDLLRGEAFAPAHLFARPEAHAAAAAAIPEDVWRDALLVALRATTTLRGFSVCRGPGDFDPAHPEVKTEFLLHMVEVVLRRVDAALFGLPGRGREVRTALARVARETKVE